MPVATQWQAIPNPNARADTDPPYLIRDPSGWPVALVWQPADRDLATAAPQLLAAVKAFVRDRATCPTANGADLDAWEMLRAAIARAEGAIG